MNTIFDYGPEIYVPYLLITLVMYSTIPLLFAVLRKKKITTRKYNVLCYLLNIVVWIVAISFEFSNNNITPCIIWTGVFSWLGIKILEKKELIVSSGYAAPSGESRLENDIANKTIISKWNDQ